MMPGTATWLDKATHFPQKSWAVPLTFFNVWIFFHIQKKNFCTVQPTTSVNRMCWYASRWALKMIYALRSGRFDLWMSLFLSKFNLNVRNIWFGLNWIENTYVFLVLTYKAEELWSTLSRQWRFSFLASGSWRSRGHRWTWRSCPPIGTWQFPQHFCHPFTLVTGHWAGSLVLFVPCAMCDVRPCDLSRPLFWFLNFPFRVV